MFTCKLELHLCREWKYFNYEPRAVRFACEVGSLEGKDVVSGIKLPQFSSATVPKVHEIFFSPPWGLGYRGRGWAVMLFFLYKLSSVLFFLGILFIQANTCDFNQERNYSSCFYTYIYVCMCVPLAFLMIIWLANCCRRRDHLGMLHLRNPGTIFGLSSGDNMGLTLI
jgi:hypothetical protein